MFDWLELHISELFAPSNQSSHIYQGWYYRYYPARDNYVAVNPGGEVYVLGDAWGGAQHVGALETLLAQINNVGNNSSSSISDDSVTIPDSTALFQWVKNNYHSYASSDISITAPDIAENGAVVPVTGKIAAGYNYGPGQMWIFVDGNSSPAAGFVHFYRNEDEYFVSTRVKMAHSGYVYFVYIAENGQIVMNRKKVNVTVFGIARNDYCEQTKDVIDCGDTHNMTSRDIKARAKVSSNAAIVKALFSNPMLPNNAITNIDFYVENTLFATARFTVNISKNPYLSIKTNLGKRGNTISINVKSINGTSSNSVLIH